MEVSRAAFIVNCWLCEWININMESFDPSFTLMKYNLLHHQVGFWYINKGSFPAPRLNYWNIFLVTCRNPTQTYQRIQSHTPKKGQVPYPFQVWNPVYSAPLFRYVHIMLGSIIASTRYLELKGWCEPFNCTIHSKTANVCTLYHFLILDRTFEENLNKYIYYSNITNIIC